MNLEMKGITKSFGANDVLHGIDFSLSEGDICALLGENGAGKSTLMNILGGVISADKGEILIDGVKQNFKDPSKSLDAGIGFIHQELNLINDLNVYENMFINREIKKKSGLLDVKEMIKQSKEIFDRINVDIDPTSMVRDLDPSYKQIVEIARALMMNAKIIIMDEPTTSLTDPEIKRVFDMMRNLKKQKVGTVFISHKLKEVMEICDKYVVLRDGNLVAGGAISDTSIAEITKHMVGHEVSTQSLQREKTLGEEVLRVENLELEGKFKDINFEIKKGEVVGFTGLLGDGRGDLFQTVFGCNEKYKGKIFVRDKEVHMKGIDVALKNGIGYLPRDRKENAIIKDLNILDNGTVVTWDKFVSGLLINDNNQKKAFMQKKEELRIKLENAKLSINSLSGGNQQKVVLAKWLLATPDVLILDNPTQGVDVGAKEDIYDIILELAQQGMAVIILSNEAGEIIRTCDRTFVMFHGQIMGEMGIEDMTEEKIMRLATGGDLTEG